MSKRLSKQYRAKKCDTCGITGKYYAKGKCNVCYSRARIASKPGLKEEYDRRKRERVLEELYGITHARYEEMVEMQGGRCAICEESLKTVESKNVKHYCVDHDHKTGQVRGILCTNCNFGIGHFKDDETRLQSALMYIRKHSTWLR